MGAIPLTLSFSLWEKGRLIVALRVKRRSLSHWATIFTHLFAVCLAFWPGG